MILSSSLSKVFYSYGLALGHGECAFLYELDLWCEQDFVLKCSLYVAGHFLQLWIGVGVESVELYFHGHDVAVVDCVEGDEVVGAEAWVLDEDFLYLHWEDVDALDDEHVVGAALDAVDAAVCAPAGALAGQYACEVAGAVAQDWHHGAVEGGDHHLSHLSVGHWLEGVGVYNLEYVVVFPKVHAVLLFALEGYSGSVHLCHAEGVVGFHSEHALDALSLLFGVWLCSYDECAEAGGGGVYAFALEHFCHVDGVGWYGVEACCTEVAYKLDLSLGVACGGGHGGGSEFLGAVLESESAGEHAVSA